MSETTGAATVQRPGEEAITFEVERESGQNVREPLTGQIPPIDVGKDRYPYCIVWSPLPCIRCVDCANISTGACKDSGLWFVIDV